jgi:transposase
MGCRTERGAAGVASEEHRAAFVIRPREEIQVYLCCEVVDMRKSINGLSVLVEETLQLDPFAPHLFVFCNRKRNRLKALYWERNGFVLWYKALQRDRFPWPRERDTGPVELTGRELNWLLDGIDIFRLRPHEELSYNSVL